MTDATMQISRDDLTEMLGAELRRRTASAKDLARRTGCDARSAEDYRAGRKLPTLATFVAMARVLGEDLAEIIITPDAAKARFDREERELAEKLELVRARRRLVGAGIGAAAAAKADSPAAVGDQAGTARKAAAVAPSREERP